MRLLVSSVLASAVLASLVAVTACPSSSSVAPDCTAAANACDGNVTCKTHCGFGPRTTKLERFDCGSAATCTLCAPENTTSEQGAKQVAVCVREGVSG